MPEEKLVNVFCGPHCGAYVCEFQAVVKEGKVENLRIHPKTKHPPCAVGWTNAKRLYHPDRLLYPLKRVGERGDGKWERISWDEAMDYVAKGLTEVKQKYGNESIVLYSYVAHHGSPGGAADRSVTPLRLFNLWGGCIHLFDRGNLCAAAYWQSMRRFTGTIHLARPLPKDTELMVIWSSNPVATSRRITPRTIMESKEQYGLKVVVIDPQFTETAALLADEYLPIRPGTDAALALAWLRVIIAEGLYKKDVVLNHTNALFLVRSDNGKMLREKDVGGPSDKYMVWDAKTQQARTFDTAGVEPALTGSQTVKGITVKPVWQRLIELVEPWTAAKAAEATGLPAESIVNLAREFGRKKSKIQFFPIPRFNTTSYGEYASIASEMINVLSGGIIGRMVMRENPHAHIDVGFHATHFDTQVVPNPVSKKVPVGHLAEAILNPKRYGTNIKALYLFRANPVNQHASTQKTIEALKKLDLVVVADLFMSATAQYADIVLPACTYLERSSIREASPVGVGGWTIYYDLPRQLYYCDKAVEPLGESKDDYDITRLLAQKLGMGQDYPWRNAEEWIADNLEKAKENPKYPWLKDVTIDRLKREGIVDVPIPTPPIDWNMPTPSGRVEFYNEELIDMGYEPLPVYLPPRESPEGSPELYKKYPLQLLTSKFKLRPNSSYGNQPELREMYTPDVLMNPEDAAPRGIKDGDKVTVFNDRGQIHLKASVKEAIRPGVVRIYQGQWPADGNVNLLSSDELTLYGENPTYNTGLVNIRKA
ncbi:MAG: molybdopterin-dependent oxidoreductase [Chloroflexi bacterium]|nr:molybdopterin-dependent oxidoreductase [Chloroflexota bacterium]